MGDIKCKVCGEPWGSFGVYHGDMTRWQAKLLLQGAGCPDCEGVSPFEVLTPTERLAGIEDPRERVEDDHYRSLVSAATATDLALADPSEEVEWKEPEPPVLWTCLGCGVEVIHDPNTDFPDGRLDGEEKGEMVWNGGKRVHYWRGWSYSYGGDHDHDDPTAEPTVKAALADTEGYCPGCAEMCPDCGEVMIFKRDELDAEGPTQFLVDEGDFHRCRSVCESCYQDWQDEQEDGQDFDADEEDFSSDWED